MILVATTPELPANVGFPWGDMIEYTNTENRGVGLALNAVHEQLCVLADLTRIQIEQGLALTRRVNAMQQAVGG